MKADKIDLLILIVLATVSLPYGVLAQTPSKSTAEWSAPEFPGFENVESQKRRAVSLGGPSFATEIHVEMVEKLPAALACTEVLARAQWRQDILLATVPKAHFDNCQFAAATDYVREQLAQALAAGGMRERDEALSALGRALHAIQDFYSHSNYVERTTREYALLGGVPIQRVWTQQGKEALLKQVTEGLQSGQVWWEPGNICRPPIQSHAELNKDSPDSLSGKQIVSAWGVSEFQAARDLARRASIEFMRDSFAMPQLANLASQCQWSVGFLLATDNRTGK